MYSQYFEEEIISSILTKDFRLNLENNLLSNVIIDIGSHDGITNSNVAKLIFEHQNMFQIFFVEANKKRIKLIEKNYKNINCSIIDKYVSSKNILKIFKLNNVPQECFLLTIDIDGDDLSVLNELLINNYKFEIIIIEYNPTFGTEFDFINPEGFRLGNSYSSIKKIVERFGMELYAVTPCNMIFVNKLLKLDNSKYSKLNPVIQYGFGYDGTLIQMNKSNAITTYNFAEFLVSPWTGLTFRQPIPKIFRNYEINAIKKTLYNTIFYLINFFFLIKHKFKNRKMRARRDLNP